MSGHEVSRVVGSILSAFHNGMDIFRRMKAKGRPKKRNKDEFQPPGEVQLQNSLQVRPKEIQSEYNKGVNRLGHRFEIGDSIAQTSLAHTLLVLNTGLINILNVALSDDSRKRESSKRSLLSLSEVAAADALHALSQLDLRLSPPRLIASSQLSLPPPAAKAGHKQSKSHEEKAKQKVASKAAKRVIHLSDKKLRPEPLLVRGGWIRPKSGSSLASSASTSKTSLARPTHQRSNSSPAVPKSSETRSRRGSQNSDETETSPKPNTPSAGLTKGRPHHRRTMSSPRFDRQPSVPVVASDLFEPQDSILAGTPIFTAPSAPAQDPPPIPPKIPLHSRPTNIQPSANVGMRIRPPSVATFQTASTKIGEIPEHRWPRQQGREHAIGQTSGQENYRPLPYVIPPPLNPVEIENIEKRGRGGRGFKFWKRAEREGGGRGVLAF